MFCKTKMSLKLKKVQPGGFLKISYIRNADDIIILMFASKRYSEGVLKHEQQPSYYNS